MPPSLVHLFGERVRLGAYRPALRDRVGGRWTSWQAWHERSSALAAWLIERGLAAGDRVVLISSTRQAWFEIDLAILMAGAVTVPLYPTLAAEQHAAQVLDAGARWVVSEDPLLLARLQRALPSPGPLKGALVIERRGVARQPDERGRKSVDLDELREEHEVAIVSYDDAVDEGRSAVPRQRDELAAREKALTPRSLATIVYTSGTDGTPKGVQLTHGNLLFETEALARVFELGPGDEQLLVLPLAHVFGRILEFSQLQVGYATTFSQSPSHLAAELTEVEPTFFGAVPRLFEQIHAQLLRSLDQRGPLVRAGAERALAVAQQAAEHELRGDPVPLPLALSRRAAERLVLGELRALFGRRLRFAASGGAPLSPALVTWFHALGVTVLEGYGLTETSSASHVNRPGQVRPGWVGEPLPGVETRLGPDDEVLVRGGNVFAGYWEKPELTARALDDDGWLHTGDVGRLDRQRLQIVGRLKELLVTSGGHKVAPQPIEAALQQSRWIQHAVLLGEGRPHLVALLSPRDEPGRRARPDELRAAIQADIDALNRKLASFEQIRAFALLDVPLDAEVGELTPTGKLRRATIQERHRALIARLYGEPV